MQAVCQSFWKDETGATMTEYGLLVALIALVAAAGAGLFGISVNDNLFCMASTVSGVPCP